MIVMIGFDPHKASHTAVAIDGDEQVLDRIWVRATRTQANESADAASCSQRQLGPACETVVGFPATLASQVRLLGSGRSTKNDLNDAVAVAVCALRSDLPRVITDSTDAGKAIRLVVKRHRDQARLRALQARRNRRPGRHWEGKPSAQRPEIRT